MSERLIPIPIPPVWMVLRDLEKSKGRPLTQHEVLEARDKAVCVVMTEARANAYYDTTGFFDLQLDDIWQDWQSFRQTLPASST